MPSGRLECPCQRQSRDRQGEEKQDGCGTSTKQDALPGREARLLQKKPEDGEAAGRRGAVVFARNCPKLRSPETNPNPDRHGRHPKDKREGAPHPSILEPPFPTEAPAVRLGTLLLPLDH